MKILYGVQATGNGHITRARALAPALAGQGLEVDYLFSGRKAEDLFDMEPFGEYQVKRGLTFITSDGKVCYFKTLKEASLRQLWKDVRSLDLSSYDLVITDYEPITAWAASLNKVPVVGIGHQYAFTFDVPRDSNSAVSEWIMRWFAPSKISLGAHWHHFNAPILPPIIHGDKQDREADPDSVLVYLPFEDSKRVIKLLQPMAQWKFRLHCKDYEPGVYGNVEVFPFSRDGFQNNLKDCQSVLCNAGFELVSEALHLGKRILVKPLMGQMEQASNAKALEVLGLARRMNGLDAEAITNWLEQGDLVQVDIPDVAAAIAEWISKGDLDDAQGLSDKLWAEVTSPQKPEIYQSYDGNLIFA